MTISLDTTEKAELLNRRLTVWLCRIVGLALFCLGMEYWVRIVGFYEGALWRFDLMPVWWKVVAPTLAVLYPVAGVGLWMAVSWGPVVWILVVSIEAVMHLMFPGLFGAASLWLVANIVGFVLFVVLKMAGWWIARRRMARQG